METNFDILTERNDLRIECSELRRRVEELTGTKREVALQCAVEFLARTDIAGLYHVLEAANDFLPFLLGKDKP